MTEPPFGITVCGIEELEGHGATGPTHVLSILDPLHPVPGAFGAYGEHARLELRFHDVVDPAPDQTMPSPADVDAILQLGRDLMTEPAASRHLLVHCHAGISRSTAAMALILAQAMPLVPAPEILATVHGIREKAWPNLRMMELGDAKLGRGGSLVAATHALHGVQLRKRPHLAEFMAGLGRQREIDGATYEAAPS